MSIINTNRFIFSGQFKYSAIVKQVDENITAPIAFKTAGIFQDQVTLLPF
jgi:hypothetical protein